MNRKEFRYIIYLLLLSFGVILASLTIIAKPQGGNVVAGDITIGSDSGNGIDTLITQLSQKGIIDWQSFGISETEHTHFAQPGASAITLNRIIGGDPSSILGRLTATGQILLINPAGILFGPKAVVDVAGLIATTANISNEDFLAGNYHFIQGPNVSNNGKIINQGYIKIADHGMVALVAPSVENAGIIEANFGIVILGSTPSRSAYTLDFYGDQLLHFALPEEVQQDISTAIKQSGRITAHGGKVLLSASTAKSIVDRAINMSGIIEANTIGYRSGEIVLMGGDRGVVEVTGKLTARGNKEGELGGKVKVLGEKVGLFKGAEIDVSGMSGGGEVLIGGDYLGGGNVPNATATYVDEEAAIFANAIKSGDGGRIIIWSDNSTRFYGTAEAKGGEEGGSGGFIETSSKNWLDVRGARIDLSAASGEFGTWLLDPYNVTIRDVGGSSGGGWTEPPPVWLWTPDSNDSVIAVFELINRLNSGNVVITTTGVGTEQAGDITVADAISSLSSISSTLSLQAAHDIIINAAINVADLNLILEASGDININAGGLINVGSLTTQGSGATTNIYAATVNTSGAQTYNTPVVLRADTTLTSTGGGDITFVNTLDSNEVPHILAINTSGRTIFGGIVGGNNALGGLATDVGGATYISGGAIYTKGTQTYNDAVILANNILLQSGGGDIAFGSTISNAPSNKYSLILDATNPNAAINFGNITFSGAVGSLTNPLNALVVLSANNVTAATYLYVNNFIQLAGEGTTAFVYNYDALGNFIPTLFTTPVDSSGHGTGFAYIVTNSVSGAIDVGAPFYLGTNQADLYGYVGGLTDAAAIKDIRLLRRIAPMTNFFERIDLFGLNVYNVLPYFMLKDILASLEEDVFLQFIADYVNVYCGDEGGEYLWLLNPSIECGV